MMWKKRRRRPLSAFSVLCLACGLLLLIGNLYMIHTGYLHTKVSALEVSGWQETSIQLPLALLVDDDAGYRRAVHVVDPKLRKLMENGRGGRSDDRRHFVDVGASHLRRSLALTSDCMTYAYNVTERDFLASGWTKAVYRATSNGHVVAVKTVDTKGRDMADCLQTTNLNTQQCYAHSSQKILKEILLLNGLSHPNIIKSLGHCVPERPFNKNDVRSLVSMTTEIGESIDIIKLLQMSWEDRLRVSYGLTQLLTYLAHSPFGSLSLNDFRRQQFVLVDGDIKLSDVDDVGFDEPTCNKSSDCDMHFSSTNFTLRVKCMGGRCEGLNEKKNIFNAARHFTTFLLPHGAPASLRHQVDHIVSAYGNVTSSANQLLSMLEQVVDKYKTGVYLNRQPDQLTTDYECLEGKDLSGLFDYRCRYSVASVGCTVSVFDQGEAEAMCNADSNCRAFILTQHTTWTGRTVVHLKNNVTTPTVNFQTTLCLKPKR